MSSNGGVSLNRRGNVVTATRSLVVKVLHVSTPATFLRLLDISAFKNTSLHVVGNDLVVAKMVSKIGNNNVSLMIILDHMLAQEIYTLHGHQDKSNFFRKQMHGTYCPGRLSCLHKDESV